MGRGDSADTTAAIERLIAEARQDVDRHGQWTCLWVSTPTITFRAAGCLVTQLITVPPRVCGTLARVGGQDCDERRQAPIGSRHPVSWRDDVAGGNDRQIRSEDHRSVNLRVRPPLTWHRRCHK